MLHLEPQSSALSLARVYRHLRPLRAAVVAFSRAYEAHCSNCSTSTATSNGPSFYRAGAADRCDQLDWNRSKRTKRPAAIAAPASSSPFKHSLARSRRKASASTTYASSSRRTAPQHPKAPPSVDLRISPAQLALHIPRVFDPTPPLELIQRTTHLLQAFQNILELIYRHHPETATLTLLEISARQVGAQIESLLAQLESERDGNVEDYSQGELELERSLVQDECYQACPPHTYHWILAEHATTILVDEFDSVEAPLELVQLVFDLCLSVNASGEASRFHRLLISTSLAPSRASLSKVRPTSSSSATSFVSLLEQTRDPYSLLSELEHVLSYSTFSDKLFFHPYLSTHHHRLDSVRSIERLEQYLELMVRIGTGMVKSCIGVYEAELAAEGLGESTRQGLDKDTRQVCDRIMRLLGIDSNEKVTDLPLEGLRRELQGLYRLARTVEEFGDEPPDPEQEAMSEQIGTIMIMLDLVNLVHYPNFLSDTCHEDSIKFSPDLLIRLIETYFALASNSIRAITAMTPLLDFKALYRRLESTQFWSANRELEQTILARVLEELEEIPFDDDQDEDDDADENIGQDQADDDLIRAQVLRRLAQLNEEDEKRRRGFSSSSPIVVRQAYSTSRASQRQNRRTRFEVSASEEEQEDVTQNSSGSDDDLVIISPSPSFSPSRSPSPRSSAHLPSTVLAIQLVPDIVIGIKFLPLKKPISATPERQRPTTTRNDRSTQHSDERSKYRLFLFSNANAKGRQTLP
ncbi:uncharacterized protein JCM15063_005283 [Sporobolomyces koalae]|uniref:uncharacterized protein n=1 Tax=Sporobolomyces koalae TaxID=500713 RepID=UPI003179C6C6